MTSLPVLSNRLTYSRATCFKTCPRKHYLQYELGIRRKRSSKPLRMGSAVHDAVDARARGMDEDSAILLGIAPYAEIPAWAAEDETKLHEWLVERETVARLLRGYFWYWGGASGGGAFYGMEIIQSEVAYELPIINPDTGGVSRTFTHAGKRDRIVKLLDSGALAEPQPWNLERARLAVMEMKTCSEDLAPESDYWKRLLIDQQITGYYTSAIDQGFAVETVLYDVIRKPSIRPKQIPLLDEEGRKIVVDANGERMLKTNLKKDGSPGAGHGEPYQSGNAEKGWILLSRVETPEEYGERLNQDIAERPEWYFARREIPRMNADLEEFRFELWQTADAIREARRTGRHYRNTAACRAFSSPCEFFQICTESIDVFNALPDAYERVGDVHPELQNTTDEEQS